MLPKPIKPRAPDVSISDHAHERWLERAAGRRPKKRTALAAMVERRLYEHLRTKGIATVGLAVTLDVGGGIAAELLLTEMGWICRTFIYIKDAS